jgi:hypothetical protein
MKKETIMKTRSSSAMACMAAGLVCFGMTSPANAIPASMSSAAGDRPSGLPVLLVGGKAVIQLPESVDRGQAVTVTVGGGGALGILEIWGPTGTAVAGRTVSETPVVDGVAALTAPAEAGSYEARYYDASGQLRGQAELEVAEFPVTLSAPNPFGAGYDTEIVWTGPAAPGDMIQMVDPASGVVLAETPAQGQPGATNRASLRVPERPGQYQVRYWSSRGTVLAELPAPVGEGIAWLRSPTEVVAGTEFAAEWIGPGDPAYQYQVVDPATGSILDAVSAQASADGTVLAATLTAPEKPGDYRVRFINMATGFILSELPLDVDSP